MKKFLTAAALSALATTTMAQTTIYGVLDASVNTITNASATTDRTTAFVDGAISSSRLGFRGSEDLGGGKRAVFQLESDAMTNNGGTHQNGLFRRGAYAGLQTNLGEITLGTRLNPLIGTHSALMPLAGNSFDTTISTAFGYADFYTKNAVTYVSPRLAGITAQVQYGFANTAGLDLPGSVLAGSLRYDAGALSILMAGQDRRGGGTTSSSNATATAAQGDITTWTAGAQYKVTTRLTAAAAYVRNDIAGLEKTNMQFGARYDLSPTSSIGINHMRSNTEDNNLTNLQVRHALSRRTTIYTQLAVADNSGLSPVRVLNTNTGSSPAVNVSGFAAVANQVQRSVGAGIIHSF